MAYIIDQVVVFVLALVAACILAAIVGFLVAAANSGIVAISIAQWIISLSVLFFSIGNLFYYAICESSAWQATLGKKWLGLKIVDMRGNRIGFWRGIGRYLGKFLSSAILDIGFLMILWTDKRQGLHDKLAETLIVKA